MALVAVHMNVEKWDAFAARFMRGEQEPANGRDAWRAVAIEEASRIALILHTRGVKSILEVGCGVGRLTPFLATLFDRVMACDTSREAITATRRALGHDYHDVLLLRLKTDAPPAISTDAALVWGNLYDEDWTDEALQEHIDALLVSAPRVLIQTTRVSVVGYCEPRTLLYGPDWILVNREPKAKRGG